MLLLEQNPEKINWECLSKNPSAGALLLLEQNPEKINWRWLSTNPSAGALLLLEKNPEKINSTVRCASAARSRRAKRRSRGRGS